MAAGKEIRGKIKSVENTKKITKAMEMVAASKMRKAQDRMRAARPYSEKIRNIAAHLGEANPEYAHPFMQVKRCKRGRRHRGDDRQGFVRWHEHQRAARRDQPSCVNCKLQAFRLTKPWPLATRDWRFLNRIGAKVVSQATGTGRSRPTWTS